jgi:hypothetical protein
MIRGLLMAGGASEYVADRLATSAPVEKLDRKVKAKVKRGSTTASRKLSRALKQVNKKAKKKTGAFKKGWNRSKVMKEAHKLAKRMR